MTDNTFVYPVMKLSPYETRSKNIPKLPSAQTKKYHSSFLFQIIKDYENIPLEVRNLRTLPTFILNIKRKMLKL